MRKRGMGLRDAVTEAELFSVRGTRKRGMEKPQAEVQADSESVWREV